MRGQKRYQTSKSPAYNLGESTQTFSTQVNDTCSIFGFFDQVYQKKELERKKKNKQNMYNQDRKHIGESMLREVEFEFLNDNKDKSSGISLRTDFKQSNMMKSTMCKSANESIHQQKQLLRMRTLKDRK